MLILTRRVNETITIGTKITVTVLDIKGQQVRLGVNVPKDVAVHREEISERINAHKRESDACDNPEQPEFLPILSRGLWFLVRLPIFALLVILEPVVVLVLGGLALAGVVTTIFFTLIHLPHFPVWTMLALSIGFALVLMLYEAVLRVLSR